MEITKREIIVSVAIVAIMLTLGFFISSAIAESHRDDVQVYNTALPVDDAQTFEYGMNTSVGNAFVYGHLCAADPVSYEEIKGKYWYVEKVTEEYRRHTRTVTYTDGKGKTHTRVETYWTWDVVKRDGRRCTSAFFLGLRFAENKFRIPYYVETYIDTVQAGYHKRHVYRGAPSDYDGTVFTELRGGTISDSSEFYPNKSIEEARDDMIGSDMRWLFWTGWTLLTGLLVGIFWYIDNEWLE